MAKPMTIIFIGRSGCGKGTQIDLLKGIFSNTLSISTGDLMRDLSKQETEVGKKIKEVLDMGGLPFDQMATTLWMREIAYFLKSDQNLICDGFPRRTNEARDLCEFLTWLKRIENTKAFLLNINTDEALKKFLKKRDWPFMKMPIAYVYKNHWR